MGRDYRVHIKAKELVEQINTYYKKEFAETKRKREEWTDLNAHLRAVFKQVCIVGRSTGFFESIYVVDSLTSRIGHKTPQNFIQLFLGQHVIAVEERLDPISMQPKPRFVSEKGGALVFSQMLTGEVAVFVFPSYSELKESNDKYLLYRIFKSPGKINDKHILKSIKFFFRYSLVSSSFATPTFIDMCRIFWLKLSFWNALKALALIVPGLKNVIELTLGKSQEPGNEEEP